jgi:hypothetical protein
MLMVFSMMYFWKQPQKIIFDLPNQTNVNVCAIQNLAYPGRNTNGRS